MTSLSAAWSQRCSSKRELTVLSTTTTQKSTSYVFLNGYTNEVNNHLDMYSEVLIGRDDISKDVITLSTCFSMFVDICVRQLSLQGATVELEVEFKLQAVLPFPAPLPERPRELACRLYDSYFIF